jgi:16S rRNA (uracil1498-N3)-methyltransferase
MSRRRFFVPEIRRGEAELTGPDAEHLVRVLRVEAGQQFEISDNDKLYLAVVEAARKSVVLFKMLEELPPPPPRVELTLAPALIKFDHYEWLIEKATELGVDKIVPFEATRSEHGLALASRKRLARWEKIAVESSQQSRRFRVPTVEGTVRLPGILQMNATVRLFLDEERGGTRPILEQLPRDRKTSDHVLMLLGPEGGWTDSERQDILSAGFAPCSLGTTILRAETAAVAALAIVGAAWDLPASGS